MVTSYPPDVATSTNHKKITSGARRDAAPTPPADEPNLGRPPFLKTGTYVRWGTTEFEPSEEKPP